MLRMATLIVGSAAVAEEVVQDAFLVVAARWSSLERPGAYLRTTVVNRCAQVLRRRDAERRAYGTSPVVVEEVVPSRLIELREAMGQLSDRQRIVIVMRYFVDVSDEEIAQVIGARTSTVRSLARRALKVLRKELE